MREAELVCGEDGIWASAATGDALVGGGCVEGCVDAGDCDWGMFCRAESHRCAYKECPGEIENGVISTCDLGKASEAVSASSPSSEWVHKNGRRIGNMATASCDPGFYVEHPDEFVALAREGFKIDGK